MELDSCKGQLSPALVDPFPGLLRTRSVRKHASHDLQDRMHRLLLCGGPSIHICETTEMLPRATRDKSDPGARTRARPAAPFHWDGPRGAAAGSPASDRANSRIREKRP